MLDIRLRALKDGIFDPISRLVPPFIHPLAITLVGFLFGLSGCAASASGQSTLALTCWFLNRALDCLDGSVARQRNQASDLGGFLDLLADFIIYSLIPICCASSPAAAAAAAATTNMQKGDSSSLWSSVAILEATFHVNNFVLFYIAAVTEKREAAATIEQANKNLKIRASSTNGMGGKKASKQRKELTSLSMRPSLIEGAESALIFTVMLARPALVENLSRWMAVLVSVGIIDRTLFLIRIL